MPGACTGNMPASRMSAFTITSNTIICSLLECGKNAIGVIRQWGIGSDRAMFIAIKGISTEEYRYPEHRKTLIVDLGSADANVSKYGKILIIVSGFAVGNSDMFRCSGNRLCCKNRKKCKLEPL
jgi:hypothetical protein